MTFMRQFPTHGKFGLELQRRGLTYVQMVMCANIIRCPMQNRSRQLLLSKVRQQPFRTKASPYRIQTSRRGLNDAAPDFVAGLMLLGADFGDYYTGRVPANRIGFATWVAEATCDPIILVDVSRGLRAGYRCPVTVNRLSDVLNGHRPMTGSMPALLSECLRLLSDQSIILPDVIEHQEAS